VFTLHLQEGILAFNDSRNDLDHFLGAVDVIHGHGRAMFVGQLAQQSVHVLCVTCVCVCVCVCVYVNVSFSWSVATNCSEVTTAEFATYLSLFKAIGMSFYRHPLLRGHVFPYQIHRPRGSRGSCTPLTARSPLNATVPRYNTTIQRVVNVHNSPVQQYYFKVY
jgi:hypothetical protein